MVLAKSPSSLTVARPFLSFAVPKSSNQCSGLSMHWSTRCVPSGNATMAFFTVAVRRAIHGDVADEEASKGVRIIGLADDADVFGGEPNDAGLGVRCAGY